MDRNIEFRAWDYLNSSFVYWKIHEDKPNSLLNNTKDPQQFTGLVDKEQNNIYEGDIIFCVDDLDFYEVVFHKGMFLVKIDDGDFSPLYDYIHDSLVVGHIFNKNAKDLRERLKREI
jgi:hypothetical protein